MGCACVIVVLSSFSAGQTDGAVPISLPFAVHRADTACSFLSQVTNRSRYVGKSQDDSFLCVDVRWLKDGFFGSLDVKFEIET